MTRDSALSDTSIGMTGHFKRFVAVDEEIKLAKRKLEQLSLAGEGKKTATDAPPTAAATSTIVKDTVGGGACNSPIASTASHQLALEFMEFSDSSDEDDDDEWAGGKEEESRAVTPPPALLQPSQSVVVTSSSNSHCSSHPPVMPSQPLLPNPPSLLAPPTFRPQPSVVPTVHPPLANMRPRPQYTMPGPPVFHPACHPVPSSHFPVFQRPPLFQVPPFTLPGTGRQQPWQAGFHPRPRPINTKPLMGFSGFQNVI